MAPTYSLKIKVYKGLKVPKKLDTHQAVANVLMQQQGKLNIQDLREGNRSTVTY